MDTGKRAKDKRRLSVEKQTERLQRVRSHNRSKTQVNIHPSPVTFPNLFDKYFMLVQQKQVDIMRHQHPLTKKY